MDNVVDELVRTARRCERGAAAFDAEDVKDLQSRILDAAAEVARAWSGSWIGYQARVYIRGLRPTRPGEHFDKVWGSPDRLSSATVGDWAEYEHEAIVEEILQRAGATANDLKLFDRLFEKGVETFEEASDDLLATIDAVLSMQGDAVLSRTRDEIAEIRSHFTVRQMIAAKSPNQIMTRDQRAANGGIVVPPHVQLELEILSRITPGPGLTELAKRARYLKKYLEKRQNMKGKSIARVDGKIFIGHGHSTVWREVKDFVQDRLRLPWDEFNRTPTAGLSTKERLETMLDDACFAFLVMTAEDEHADGSKVARANVIHEVGLFQGRLGFERAIILLEDGCEEFSNVAGITQLRFPKGRMSAIFEDIRGVLEREKILP